MFIINISEPKTSGEAGMAYGLSIVVLGVGLAVSSLVLTIAIANKNGFDWVAGPRTLILGIGWACFVAATFSCVVFRWEWHPGDFPSFLRWFSLAYGQVWIPLLALVPCYVLLNAELRASVSPNLFKIPIIFGFAISALIVSGLLYSWMNASMKKQKAYIEKLEKEDNQRIQEQLSQIADYQPGVDRVTKILRLTGSYQHDSVRFPALAKMKENPDWEAQLIELLDDEHHFMDVYSFISGNKVDHRELFFDPLNRSILRLADRIREDITNANNLQTWTFEWSYLDRLLRGIDTQFSDLSMDFRPAIQQLKEAFDTPRPEQFKNVRFDEEITVKNWLKAHR
ncbi:MAG: hypothetical protein R3B93_09845 [Bacteroidia bacterium]